MKKFAAAVCQMDSQDNKDENLKTAGNLILDAAAKGAKLAVLPEMMNYIGKGYKSQAEPIPGPTSDFLCRMAGQAGIWVAGGSFPEETDANPKNTMLLIDPKGKIVQKYSKIHMFDVDIENGVSYRESDTSLAGDTIVLADMELGKLGFAICYDIRFGEMFRLLALCGAQIICVPASFTMESGKDHWETLLRTRAIENGVYILAANQTGRKKTMNTYGNSMIIDPWGTVIARAGERTECIIAEIDLEYLASVRRQIPVLENRRQDVYSLYGANISEYRQ